jgi:hypothetical protein
MARTKNDLDPEILKSLAASVGTVGKPLDHERWEVYARYRCQGFTRSDSYRIAYESTSLNVSELARQLEREHPEVLARIAELTEEYTKLVLEFNPEQSLARWDALYAAAMSKGDVKAAITIQTHIDKLSGVGSATEKKKLNEGSANLTFSDPRDWRAGASKALESLKHLKSKDEVEEALSVVNATRADLETKVLVGDKRNV